MLPLAAMLSVTGCASGTPATECAGWRPITMSRLDVLTDQTADQINAHNRFGEGRCWKAPG